MIYPELSFTLKIYQTIDDDSEENTEVLEENPTEENISTPITGNSIKSSGRF